MFTDASNHYFVEPVPVYLHNIHGEIHEKPHIVFRRSLEETKKSYSRVVGSNLWNGSLKKNPKGLNLYLEYFIIVQKIYGFSSTSITSRRSLSMRQRNLKEDNLRESHLP